jgi:hypothetical protein
MNLISVPRVEEISKALKNNSAQNRISVAMSQNVAKSSGNFLTWKLLNA